jgi:hypothetical protein
MFHHFSFLTKLGVNVLPLEAISTQKNMADIQTYDVGNKIATLHAMSWIAVGNGSSEIMQLPSDIFVRMELIKDLLEK